MSQSTNYKLKIDFLISNDDTSLIQQSRTKKYGKCSSCKRIRKPSDENNQICRYCYDYNAELLSGNKVIDDFVKYTHINNVAVNGWKMKFVPYDKFENIEFISEGGFSKVYKASWIAGECQHVVLKKLNNSKNITSKELNELKLSYDFSATVWNKGNVSKYYGITQEPTTQEMMFVMPYYSSGDLIHYMKKNFYNISWEKKLENLKGLIFGLEGLHSANIAHRDFHSGNILIDDKANATIGDLGISKSATSRSTDDNEIYGIIPYMAPEIFQGQRYTTVSDIYSFGMIMWEFMTGRRPFWDRNHDTDLIIDIIDGLRPPIDTNAPKGYIELMKECWHPDPERRPTADSIISFAYYSSGKPFDIMLNNERKNPTKIIESPDIGPVTYNSDAIYKSRPLSSMIQSAMSSRSLRTKSTDSFYYYPKSGTNFTGKREFVDGLCDFNLIENNYDDDKVKRVKSLVYENNSYLTKENEFDT